MIKILQQFLVSKLKAITNKIYQDYCKKPKPLKITKEEFDKAEF